MDSELQFQLGKTVVTLNCCFAPIQQNLEPAFLAIAGIFSSLRADPHADVRRQETLRVRGQESLLLPPLHSLQMLMSSTV